MKKLIAYTLIVTTGFIAQAQAADLFVNTTQPCSSTQECTLISNSCADNCAFVPVNAGNLPALSSQYQARCGKAMNEGAQCQMNPPVKAACINSRCTIDYSTLGNADAKDYKAGAYPDAENAVPDKVTGDYSKVNDRDGKFTAYDLPADLVRQNSVGQLVTTVAPASGTAAPVPTAAAHGVQVPNAPNAPTAAASTQTTPPPALAPYYAPTAPTTPAAPQTPSQVQGSLSTPVPRAVPAVPSAGVSGAIPAPQTATTTAAVTYPVPEQVTPAAAAPMPMAGELANISPAAGDTAPNTPTAPPSLGDSGTMFADRIEAARASGLPATAALPPPSQQAPLYNPALTPATRNNSRY